MTDTYHKLEKIINNHFVGISIKEDQSTSVKRNQIYAIRRGENISHWFTSPYDRTTSQISGIDSFLRFKTMDIATAEPSNPSGLHIEKFLYTLEPNARHKSSGLTICDRSSLAYQVASAKSLTCIVQPKRIGRIIKISSRLKLNLLNEHIALKGLHASVKAPKPISYEEIDSKYASSQQSLIRGSTPKRSSTLDELIRLELENLSSNDITTSIKVETERILDTLHQKDLNIHQKERITQLLRANKCNQDVQAATTHGDLKLENIKTWRTHQSTSQTSISFLDWEFSKEIGIGAIDFLRWRLDKAYQKATTIKELLEIAKIKEIKSALRASKISGHSLSIDQLMRLHLATHAVDRLHSFYRPNTKNSRLNNLVKLLNSDWPGNLDDH